MKKRTFLCGALAALAGLLFKKARAEEKSSEQWWRERDFVFEGTPGTEYWWPRDRAITFVDPKCDELNFPVSAYPLSRIKGNIQDNMREALIEHRKRSPVAHIHLIHVVGESSKFGLMISETKCAVTTDYHFGSPHVLTSMNWTPSP